MYTNSFNYLTSHELTELCHALLEVEPGEAGYQPGQEPAAARHDRQILDIIRQWYHEMIYLLVLLC